MMDIRRSRTLWRVALAIAATAIVVVVAGGAFLFSGSTVDCVETSEPGSLILRCDFVVRESPKAVWDAFTRTDVSRPFYFDAVLQADLRPGGRWRFVTENRERLLAGGEVLALDPSRRFVHTFEAADLDDPPSRITVRLEPLDDGCQVSLVHDRFADRTRTYERFRRAHPLALSAMKSFLEEGELPLRARLYTAIFKPGMNLFTVRAEPWE